MQFKKIILNTSWLISGQVATRVFKFLVVLYAIKKLSFDGYGTFAHALAYVSIFFIIISLLHTLSPLHHELAKRNDEHHSILGEHIPWRLMLLGVAFLVLLGIGVISHIAPIPLLLLLGLSLSLDFLRDIFGIVLQSKEHMREEGTSLAAQTGVTLLLVLVLFTVGNATSVLLAACYFFGSLGGLLVTLYFLSHHISFREVVKKSTWPTLVFIKTYIPYGLGFGVAWTITISFIFQFALFILGYYASSAIVGITSLLFQIVQVALVPYMMFGASSLTLMSSQSNEESKQRSFSNVLTLGLIGVSLYTMLIAAASFFLVPIIFSETWQLFVGQATPKLLLIIHFGSMLVIFFYMFLALGKFIKVIKYLSAAALLGISVLAYGLLKNQFGFFFGGIGIFYALISIILFLQLRTYLGESFKKVIQLPLGIFLVTVVVLGIFLFYGVSLWPIVIITGVYLFSFPKLKELIRTHATLFS